MIIRSSKLELIKKSSNGLLNESSKTVLKQQEEIKPVIKSEKKKKKSQPIIVEPDIFIEEKVVETEDEDLSHWLKEDENII